ncbi:MAG: type II toxin-antitoxin system Phd/YefM family antitoxin [Pseudomonadota bacterium]
MHMTAKQAVTKFGQMMEHSGREPVFITKHGRTSRVMLSYEDFNALIQHGRVPVTAAEAPDWVVKAIENADIPAEADAADIADGLTE